MFLSRCVRKTKFCAGLTIEQCKKMPLYYSWQHIAIPKYLNISTQRTSVTLFNMKGPNIKNSFMHFELLVIKAKTGKKKEKNFLKLI